MVMTGKRLVFVTGNANKLREVKAILGQWIEIDSQNLDVPEIQGSTQEIAKEKCQRAAEIIGGPCITEDTALCFEALGGLPGPYVKHFITAVGLTGLNTLLDGFHTREAWALCTFAYSSGPGSEPVLFEGRTNGTIVPARGPQEFGWDPIFEVDRIGLTYAEMTKEQKNLVSHRSRALERLRVYLRSLPEFREQQ